MYSGWTLDEKKKMRIFEQMYPFVDKCFFDMNY